MMKGSDFTFTVQMFYLCGDRTVVIFLIIMKNKKYPTISKT